MKSLYQVFQGDNLRYLTELRGSPFSRLFYNKMTIVVNEIGKFLSFYSLRLYFGPLMLIIFFPLLIIGVIQIIKEKRLKIFVALLLAGIPAYLFDKREFIYLLPITLAYGYIVWVGAKYLIKKWRK